MNATKILSLTFIMFVSSLCHAGDDWVNNAEITVLAKIVMPSLGHDAGDVPFAIKDNITWPSTISIGNGHLNGNYYISMPKNIDCKETMALLLSAMLNNKKVNLYLRSDDGNSRYPGRPYILAVSVNN